MFGRIPAGLLQIQLDSRHFGQIWSASDHGQIPATVAGCHRIPTAGCCRIPALPGFRKSTIAEFRQSDIKHACKDQEFNFEKQFTVLNPKKKKKKKIIFQKLNKLLWSSQK